MLFHTLFELLLSMLISTNSAVPSSASNSMFLAMPTTRQTPMTITKPLPAPLPLSLRTPYQTLPMMQIQRISNFIPTLLTQIHRHVATIHSKQYFVTHASSLSLSNTPTWPFNFKILMRWHGHLPNFHRSIPMKWLKANIQSTPLRMWKGSGIKRKQTKLLLSSSPGCLTRMKASWNSLLYAIWSSILTPLKPPIPRAACI